jgi:hypothetical protein
MLEVPFVSKCFCPAICATDILVSICKDNFVTRLDGKGRGAEFMVV